MRFSERHGLAAPRSAVQVESMDAALRTALWNAYATVFVGKSGSQWSKGGTLSWLYEILWPLFFKLPVDDIPRETYRTERQIRDWFFAAPWHSVYDFVEFVATISQRSWKFRFLEGVADALKREMAGYRLSGDTIVPISDPIEISSIETAIVQTSKAPLAGAREHLATALALLSDRQAPDFRNSVKESISAVESVARVLSGEPRAELGKALKKIEDKVPLHGAFRAGISSLYGYSSDEGGIRHALLEAPTVDFDDAKFMLVACAGFVSFLVGKAICAGILE